MSTGGGQRASRVRTIFRLPFWRLRPKGTGKLRKPSKKQKLVAAILLHLIIGGSFGQADAMTSSQIDHNGKPMFEVYYYGHEDAGTPAAQFFEGMKNPGILSYTLNDNLRAEVDNAFRQWAELLGPGAKNKKPVQYFVSTYDAVNAFASGFSSTEGKGEDFDNNPNNLHDALQNGTAIEWLPGAEVLTDNPHGRRGFGVIGIGKYMGIDKNDGQYGWTTGASVPVSQEMGQVDITAILYHEIAHSVGITSNTSNSIPVEGISPDIFRFDNSADNPVSFTRHLHDQNDKAVTGSDLLVMTPNTLRQLQNNEALFAQFKEAAGYTKDTLDFADVLVVDNNDAWTGRNGVANLTFQGKNVTEALNGKTFSIANGKKVAGIPVNNWEGTDADFSHIDLARSNMSHQNYRSYKGFIEAELAILQDIGYDIDRKNFFGHSEYRDGQTYINTKGFSARNADRTAYIDGYNTATYGVGLHVFGSNNNITQAGNIFAKGDAAVGIRLDGLHDTIIVQRGTEVHGDGRNGGGVLVAYGKNHVVNIDGTVTGDGENGTGVWFDFGSNSFGAKLEYRGSYMRYKRLYDENGTITKEYNVGLNDFDDSFDDFSITDPVGGDLNGKMATLNVSGTISGQKAAIYMAKNAFVDNINLNAGAKINGDIINNWKNFDETADYMPYTETYTAFERKHPGTDYKNTIYIGGPMLQYDGKLIPYKKYVPGLVTNLNFNADMNYKGNIIGKENTKMNVNSGVLNFGGTADVVNVNVAKGASLFGGTFTVNDMTAKLAESYSDDTTGKFINHGTIGAVSKDTMMTVNGKLVSDGVLRAYGGGTAGHIAVSGATNIDSSTASVTNALPDETWKVLEAGALNGAITNPEGSPYTATGMLDTTGTIDGNILTVTSLASNNLGTTDERINETYDAMIHMHRSLIAANDPRVNEMRPLFSLDAGMAKMALSSISNGAAAQSMSLAQSGTLTGHLISSRLAEAFAQKPVKVKIPVANLAGDGEKDGIELPMKLDLPADNDFWFKAAKNWGDLNGGAYYHGAAFTVGWDKAYGKTWRAGAFVSYGTTGFADTDTRNETTDTRFGLYGGYSTGPHAGFVYLDYGWLKNDLARRIAGLGLTPKADYDSRILELGGEYKYDLNAGKDTPWHISPYVNLQLSGLWQDGYTERGAGIFGQRVSSATNTYFAGGVGMECKRYLANGSYALRLGVKHAFTGADPRLTFGYVGDNASSYEMKNEQDKTHFAMSLGGEVEFAPGWWIAGDAAIQKGAHDKDMMCALTLRRVW